MVDDAAHAGRRNAIDSGFEWCKKYIGDVLINVYEFVLESFVHINRHIIEFFRDFRDILVPCLISHHRGHLTLVQLPMLYLTYTTLHLLFARKARLRKFTTLSMWSYTLLLA